MSVAAIHIGETTIELIEPTTRDSPIAKFLEKRGPGMHHIALEVANIDEALQTLTDKQVALIDTTARTGADGTRIAFVHPKSAGGVLIELVEIPDR